MYENKIEDVPAKAVLACVDTGEFDAEASMDELAELASSANADVVGTISRSVPPTFLLPAWVPEDSKN